MGIAISNFASSTEDRASGAQVIDGSLKFDDDKTQYLRRAFTTEGNRRTFTWSCWLKLASFGDWRRIFTCEPAGSDIAGLAFRGDGNINGIRVQQQDSSNNNHYTTVSDYKDTSWYHVVMAVDTTIASPSGDRIKLYVNGELQSGSYTSGAEPAQNSTWFYNSTSNYHEIGNSTTYNTALFDGHMTQCYWIDGQQLGPEYFGYTDPLTNTWRPKKFIKQASPNDGTTWSSYLSASSGSITNAANAFNNDVLSFNTSTVNEAVFTFTPPTPIQYKNSVRIWLRTALHKARINGGTYIFNTGASVTGQWMTLATGSGSIQSIDVQYTGGSQTAINAIEVDGVILVDGLNDNGGVGTNGLYLPMDGNSPVGQDQSGRGNDWQPINFGGSVELPKATGAIPILNTNEAGTVAKGGVRTDSKTYTVTASGGNYYLDGALKPTLNAYRGGSYTFDYTGATSHPFYLSSLPDGKHNSEAYSVTFDGEDSWIDIANGVTIGTSAFTWECFFYVDNYKDFCTIFDTRESAADDANGIYLGARSDGLVYVWSNAYRIQTNRVSTGEWHHLALVRDSNNLMHLYIDGTHAYNTSGAWTYSNSVNALTRIGQTQYSTFVTGNDFEWEGKLSNVRITVGQALYTSNFTPPTTTLTTTSQGAIASNVKLLCCQSSSATTAAVTPGTLTTSGNAAAVNVSPFLYDNNHGFFGVNTATSNTTKITIPHWAPDTLYYYCNAHSGMGSSINVTTDIRKADPYAWLCTLAVPLTGPDTSDLSSNINVTTTAMTVASSSVTSGGNRNFYGSSAFYGTNANQYRHEISANSGLSFGDRPWTIECWCYRDRETASNSYQTLWSFRSNTSSDYHQAGWISFLITGSSVLYWYYGTGSGNTQFSPTEKIGLNRWTHIASVWDGKGNIELYFDGIKVHTQAISKTDWGSSTLPFYFADQAYNGGVRGLSGYMQDFRVYKGVAKYSENFVPASTDPDILPDTPSGVAGGSALTKITDGAVKFDGSNDFLQVPASEDLNVGSADFTAEAWVYPTQYGEIVGAFNLNSPYNGWLWSLSFGSAGKQMIWFNGNQQESTTVVPLNKWSHIAFSKSGTTVRYFLDGKLDGSFTPSADSTWSNQAVNIGADSNSTNAPGRKYGGFISNLRLIKGTALYTSDFTPPTEPLTAVTNTKLLTCQENQLKILTDTTNATGGNSIQNTNNSGITSTTGNRTDSNSSNLVLAVPFNGTTDDICDEIGPNTAKAATLTNSPSSENIGHFYGKSYKFTGANGQRINYAASADFNFGTGAFCIEGWYYHLEKTSSNADRRYFVHNETAWESSRWIVYCGFTSNPNRAVFYTYDTYVSNGNGPFLTGKTIFTVGNWYHIAVTRSGNTFRLFVNGRLEDSGSDSNSVGNSTIPLEVGGGASQTDRTLFGHIQDLRIYKGVAKYTAPFVPPRVPAYDSAVTPSSNIIGLAGGESLPTNFNPFTDDINAIRGQETGYATLNPLAFYLNSLALSNGNLSFTQDSINDNDYAFGNMLLNGRKIYYEFVLDFANNIPGANSCRVGICRNLNGAASEIVIYNGTGNFETLGTTDSTGASDRTYSTGDIIGLAIDCIDGSVQYFKNGIKVGTKTFTVGDDEWTPHIRVYRSTGTVTGSFNFGQKPFKFPPPDGFQTLSINNLRPSKVIIDPRKYFEPLLFPGNGTSQSITGLSFGAKPDFVWIKDRSNGSNYSHRLVDSVRGSTRVLFTDNTAIEQVNQYGTVDQFTVNGFDLRQGSNNNGDGSNTPGSDLVAWCWRAGGDSGTYNVDGVGYDTASAAGLDAGDISLDGASVGTKQGFSILKWAGTAAQGNLPHGLTQDPDFIVIKGVDNSSGSWQIWHNQFGTGSSVNRVYFNSTAAPDASTTNIFKPNPGAGTILLNTGDHFFNGAFDYICYAWHNVPGLQKFGTYVGNGSSDGPFIALDFTPALIIMKSVSAGANWIMIDYKRVQNTTNYQVLSPNLPNNENSSGASTNSIHHNGFKIRGSTDRNTNGVTYIYAAWAEAPTFNLYGAAPNGFYAVDGLEP